MKKFFSILLLVMAMALAGVSVYYFAQIRGALPAVLPAKDDIAEIVENTEPVKDGIEAELDAIDNGPFTLPDGFKVSIYAKDLEGPRVMHWITGAMLVSETKEGKVLALVDADHDGVAEGKAVVLEGLKNPHGLASRCDGEKCKLYIAEENNVSEYDYDTTEMKATNKKKLFDLPSGGGHYTRTIMFEAYPNDSKMLVSVGSSCNVCNEESDLRAKVLEYDFTTGKLSEYAKGLRNSVFMAIHPVNGDIWATENGRDNLGDDIPPDEINILKKDGNYGWPTCYGQNIHDTEFDKNTYIRNPCMEPFETSAHVDLQAHSAPLGLAFFPEEGWPEEYWYNLLVAYHGSWNRTVPTGYKLVRIKLDQNGKYLGTEDFMTGFLEKNQVYGRPVDVIIQPGGVIYVSDDKAGVIYKIAKHE